mgnify:CR=1 FL=1
MDKIGIKRPKLLIVFALFVCSSMAFGAESYKAKVVAITDGDTIKVIVFGEQVKIRLAGIDCPEKKQPWGREATEAISDLVAGQNVIIEKLTIDRYGRTIARVFVDGVNVNRALVESGNCWVYPRYAKDQKLFTLQDEAKTAQRGLWKLSKSERVAPWEWRKARR